MILPQPKTENLRHSFKFRVVQKWNGLPGHLSSIETLDDLKRELLFLSPISTSELILILVVS